MQLSRRAEEDLLLTARRQPEDHIVFPFRFYEGPNALMVHREGRQERLQRRLYRLLIDENLGRRHIGRVCDEWRCVNPYHYSLAPGHLGGRAPKAKRVIERRLDGGDLNAAKTHCPWGHPYAGDNLVIERSSKGYVRRRCRACSRDRARQRREQAGG